MDVNDLDLSIAVVLNHHGWSGAPRGNGWEPIRCPYHDDTNASASVHLEKGAFKCHACDISGDAIKLIMHYEGVSFTDAVRMATEVYGAEVSPPSRGPSRDRKQFRPRRRRGRR